MGKKNSKEHLSGREAMSQINAKIEDDVLYFKEWITDFGKILFPAILLILVAITVVISLNARKKVEEAAREALEVLQETKTEVQEVKEILFEEDAYPELNELFSRYYEALEFADIDLLMDLQSNVTSTETIRLKKMSEYIDRYENIHVYSKPGPYTDTYIVYVFSEVYLKEREEYTPGLQAFYVCKNEDGTLFINNSELTQEEALYIKNVSLQADVVDLKNSVNVSYGKIMEDNTGLSEYWAQISVDIDLAVGEQLALEARLTAQLEEEMGETEPEPEEVPEEPVIKKVRINERVNVRKSASGTADKLGSAEAGDVFILYEDLTNGWSRISFNGADGYIKTEYLSVLEDISTIETLKTMVVDTDYLNVRLGPSASTEKIGILTEGQAIEVVDIADGWCKIKFNGQLAYVSEEFVK